MLAVTTHDTKRTADVRARLDVVSEIPDEWAERVQVWRTLNVANKQTVRGRRVPDPGTVHHIMQALVGIWPLAPLGVGDLDALRERVAEYMVKAVREAKLRTTWTDPDEDFEAALRANVEALLAPDRSPRFLDDLERFVARIARAGLRNALARTVLHLASPGIPDVYMGDELWTFALVDPDNRRPVDYDSRRRVLDEVERGTSGDEASREAFLRELARAPDDGRIKLHVIRAVLAARAARPAAFGSRAYTPLAASGPGSTQLVAFGRGQGAERLVAVVPRLIAATHRAGGDLMDPGLWADTRLPLGAEWPRRWTCALTGRRVRCEPDGGLRVADLFGILPVALLLADYDA